MTKEHYYKHYPKDIIDRAFKKFPEELEEIRDSGTYLIIDTEDRNALRRHFYIIGAIEERENKTK